MKHNQAVEVGLAHCIAWYGGALCIFFEIEQL